MPQGGDWMRWSAALSLNPTGPAKDLESNYKTQLNSGNYGVIALFYATTFSSVKLSQTVPLLPTSAGATYATNAGAAYQNLIGLVGNNSGESGLSALTLALESKYSGYRLAAKGPYNTSNISGSHDYGVFAIWKKKALQ